MISISLVFIFTFLVFPGAFFQSYFSFLNSADPSKQFTWYSLIMLSTFNVFDTVGRYMGGVFQLPSKVVYFLVAARILLVVSTILIGLANKDTHNFFTSDAIKILNMVVFAFSNGFVSTLCAIEAPKQAKEDQR